MPSSLRFLTAARRCEIDDLQHLAQTAELVRVCARLIHELQRERGVSNLFLGSGGTRFAGARAVQLAETDRVLAELRTAFEALDARPEGVPQGTRLFSRLAYAFQGLDALATLRARIDAMVWDTERATVAYSRLVAAWLAVVFEAADRASEPEISRLLVALFNLMQGKEFAGQERACGAALFAAGRADEPQRQRLLHLIESQERCLQVFADFAGPVRATQLRQALSPEHLAEQERLRRQVAASAGGGPLDTALSLPWFEHCTARMDTMKAVEDSLSDDLLALCARRTAAARAELQTHLDISGQLDAGAGSTAFFDAPEAPYSPQHDAQHGLGPQLERSILELVQAQSQRLQTMADELETARASLNERKLIERAKGLLMAHRQLTEDEAHKTLRTMAMNQNRRLVDVAEALLSMAAVLPARH